MNALYKTKSQIWHQYMILSLGTFYLSWEVRLYRKILHFLNVHDTCTASVCNEKLRNDLIKGTDYIPDYLG